MGQLHSEANEKNKRKGEASIEVCVGEEVQFSSKQFASAFGRLSPEHKARVVAFYETKNRHAAADKLGLSRKRFGEVLNSIAKSMGASRVSDIFPSGFMEDRKATGKASSGELIRLVINQDYRCALSGVRLSPENANLDHITPVSVGGTNNINNLQWLESRVNAAKGTMSQSEFIEMCNRVSNWTR